MLAIRLIMFIAQAALSPHFQWMIQGQDLLLTGMIQIQAVALLERALHLHPMQQEPTGRWLLILLHYVSLLTEFLQP